MVTLVAVAVRFIWVYPAAWLPRADGIHVWFAKYDVAPGSFGDVHVRVPWSALG